MVDHILHFHLLVSHPPTSKPTKEQVSDFPSEEVIADFDHYRNSVEVHCSFQLRQEEHRMDCCLKVLLVGCKCSKKRKEVVLRILLDSDSEVEEEHHNLVPEEVGHYTLAKSKVLVVEVVDRKELAGEVEVHCRTLKEVVVDMDTERSWREESRALLKEREERLGSRAFAGLAKLERVDRSETKK